MLVGFEDLDVANDAFIRATMALQKFARVNWPTFDDTSVDDSTAVLSLCSAKSAPALSEDPAVPNPEVLISYCPSSWFECQEDWFAFTSMMVKY